MFLFFVLITFSSCNEESLLIKVDEEEILDEYSDDDSGPVPRMNEKATVYFYGDDISETNALKSTIFNQDRSWQLSMFGEPSSTGYDFSFNKLYAANQDFDIETVLLLDEVGKPAFLYFKQPGSDVLRGGIIEFDPIDDNQFYLRVYHYHSYSMLATILFESIIYVDRDDFYSNVTFGLNNEEFKGGRVSAEKNAYPSSYFTLPRLEKLLKKANNKSNARTATNTIDEGVQEFLSELENFYSSPVSNWLLQTGQLSDKEIVDKAGFSDIANSKSSQYIHESVFYLIGFSQIISSVNPINEPEFHESLNSNSKNIREDKLELENIEVSYVSSLQNLSNAYDHWYYAFYNSFQEIFDYYKTTNLFFEQVSFDKNLGTDGGLQVSLLWDLRSANLDLLIVEPSGDTLSMSHPAASGGAFMFREDSEINGFGREIAFWQENTLLGEYIILCKYVDCGTEECNAVTAEINITNGLGNTIAMSRRMSITDNEIVKIGQFTYDGNIIE